MSSSLSNTIQGDVSMNATEAKKLAHEQASRISYSAGETPQETFLSIKFDFHDNAFSTQEMIARQNLKLDPQNCLGRVAVLAAIMEKCHPGVSLKFGEVWDDYFKNILLRRLKEEPILRFDGSFMQELLMYEEPHAVVVADGVQLEPLSLAYGQLVRHPQVEQFPLWEGIAASATVSEAWLNTDVKESFQILLEAGRMCPGIILVKENMVECLELFGKITEAINLLKEILVKRSCAKILYVLYTLSGETFYRDKLVDLYEENIFEHILEAN